jgi:hypothetical protein
MIATPPATSAAIAGYLFFVSLVALFQNPEPIPVEAEGVTASVGSMSHRRWTLAQSPQCDRMAAVGLHESRDHLSMYSQQMCIVGV